MTVAARVRLLLTRRAPLLFALTAAGIFLLAPFLPLAGVPGYESALLATWVLALVGGALGVGAARQEIELERGGQLRRATSLSSTWRAFAAACVPGLLLLGVLVGWTALRTLFGPSCSSTFGLPWYPLLPLPTLLLATASGLALGFAFTGRRAAAIGLALLFGWSLASSLGPLWSGPQVYFYDHFFGYVAGPLYDEQVRIEGPLLAFRALTLAWAGLAFGAAALLRRRWRRGIDAPAHVPALLCVAALVAVGWGHGSRHDLGFAQTTETVEAALGGRLEGDRCVLVHPRELPVTEARGLLDECEHRMEELEAFFGVEAPPATVFLHRSREEKRRLVGAAQTQFAKPWLGQVHIHGRGTPHPILAHELAHLVTAPLGRGPFGVSSKLFGLFPLPGLIEGAAVAADWPGGSLTIHQSAKAMRELELAPDLKKILSAWGFWSQPASRAYTYAGSFVRWLVETKGSGAFAAAYRTGSFSGYGDGLDDLIRAWEAHLDEVELPDEALALAETRFRRPSLLRRSCAREVASLVAEARAVAASGDGPRAAALYAHLAELQPTDPSHRIGEATAWAQADEMERVVALARLADERQDPPTARARIWTLAGDALAQAGQVDAALDAYQRAGALAAGPDETRALAVRIEASQDADVARVVLPYLAKGAEADLLEIRELLQERPQWGTGWYLVGRRLYQRGAHRGAMRDLDRALAGDLPEALQREAARIRALAAMGAGAYDEACPALDALAEEGSAGEQVEAADLAGLCRATSKSRASLGTSTSPDE